MNSLIEMFAYGMATKAQIDEFQYSRKAKVKRINKIRVKDITPVFVIEEDDLP